MITKMIDLSGYMLSGKQSVTLLLNEIEGFTVMPTYIDFDLLRLQDGIVDLEKNIVEDWSLMRSNQAIVRFKKLVKKFDNSYASFPSKLFHFRNDNMEKQFKNKFHNLSNIYLDSLIETSWECEWPYPLYDMCEFESFTRKIKKRFLGKNKAFSNEFHLVDGEKFYELTKHYLTQLLSSYEGVQENTTTVVTNNAFEPFNAKKRLKYFDNAKCIIIRRDPRDMYTSAATNSIWFSKISHGQKVENFIKRFILQEKNTDKTPHKDIMFLQYEDLILDYENTKNKIFNFLEIDESLHTRKKEFLLPEESKQFIGIYKNFENQSEIRLIEEKLKEYCLDI